MAKNKMNYKYFKNDEEVEEKKDCPHEWVGQINGEGLNLDYCEKCETMRKAIKKYFVSIEQPMCKTFEVEAEDIDTALEIAKEKYENEEFVIGADDLGTDAQIMAESEDGSESTEWDEF